ncbi:unnamed protein product [Spodoptera exigua]|nr:unnamed protein product [Spodoptera exigua]
MEVPALSPAGGGGELVGRALVQARGQSREEGRGDGRAGRPGGLCRDYLRFNARKISKAAGHFTNNPSTSRRDPLKGHSAQRGRKFDSAIDWSAYSTNEAHTCDINNSEVHYGSRWRVIEIIESPYISYYSRALTVHHPPPPRAPRPAPRAPRLQR